MYQNKIICIATLLNTHGNTTTLLSVNLTLSKLCLENTKDTVVIYRWLIKGIVQSLGIKIPKCVFNFGNTLKK